MDLRLSSFRLSGKTTLTKLNPFTRVPSNWLGIEGEHLVMNNLFSWFVDGIEETTLWSLKHFLSIRSTTVISAIILPNLVNLWLKLACL